MWAFNFVRRSVSQVTTVWIVTINKRLFLSWKKSKWKFLKNVVEVFMCFFNLCFLFLLPFFYIHLSFSSIKISKSFAIYGCHHPCLIYKYFDVHYLMDIGNLLNKLINFILSIGDGDGKQMKNKTEFSYKIKG